MGGIIFDNVTITRGFPLAERLKEINIGSTSLAFGSQQQPLELRNLDFKIEDGEFVAFVDPYAPWHASAILRAVAGLEDITEGSISAGESSSIALFTSHDAQTDGEYFRDILDNRLGLRSAHDYMVARVSRTLPEGADGAIEKYSKAIGLDVSGKRVKYLSFMDRERMNLICAVAHEPQIILVNNMHCSSSDYDRRDGLLNAIKTLRQEIGGTWLYATTDTRETRGLADRTVRMDKGQVQWIMPTEEAYANPPTVKAATEFGYYVKTGAIYENHHPGSGGTEVMYKACAFMCLSDGSSLRLPYLNKRQEQLQELEGKEITVAIAPEAMRDGIHFDRTADVMDRIMAPSLDLPPQNGFGQVYHLFADPSKILFFGEDGSKLDIGYIGPKLDMKERAA